MSKLDDLEKLGRLRADGSISEADFEQRKRDLLSVQQSPVAHASGRTRLVLGSVAAVAAVLIAAIWITGAAKNVPDVAMPAKALSDDAVASPPIDPDADVWAATLDNTREGQVCAIKMQGMPAGESIEFDFYTESDEGLTELYVVGPVIETTSDGSDPVQVTLKFTTGNQSASQSKVAFKGIGTIQNTSDKLRALGAAPLGSASVSINGGIAFYKAVMESEYLNYINDRGDKFYIDLIGRNDLVNELRECLGRTDGVNSKNAAQ